MRARPIYLILIATLLASAAIWLAGSANPFTPAGYVGYLVQGALFGKAHFIALQMGPTSSGRQWLYEVTNISITPYTYTEEFKGDTAVLSRDNLKVAFKIHVIWRIKPEAVKDFVERYSTIQHGDAPDKIVTTAYDYFVKESIRNFARDEVQKRNGLEIKDEIVAIGEAVLERSHKLTENTPFAIKNVVVGNIQYPEEVANAVSRKLAATQELERKVIEIEITRKEKEKRVIEAEGIAKAMEIINISLSPQYLQYEAIKSQREMVSSPNHTTIYLPVGPMGVPLVGTIDTRREEKNAGQAP